MRSAIPISAVGLVAAVWAAIPSDAWPQERRSTIVDRDDGMTIELFAREPMLKNPVAIALDDQGRLYSVETARRGSVDIDIRAHRDWAVEDLASQSVDSLRTLFRQKMAPELSLQNAGWLADRNGDGSHDWRDLMEVPETVRLIEDLDGDGAADRSTVVYQGFNEEINGVLAGVLPVGDDVLVTVYPDLWRLRDTNQDGAADERESLFRGFGVHAAFDGHDLHGLCWGPDGKIYFSVGDNGFSVVNKEGRRLHYPNTGAVLRMNRDFSDLEVYAYGLRNVQEIAFDQDGNLFSVDNDGDLYDERERFVFIAEGSDSGWRYNWQLRNPGWSQVTGQPVYNPWVNERMWVPHHEDQPAHITPPLSNYSIGPGSFKFNPGTALTEAYRNHFFLIQFPGALVSTFRVEREGAGFRMVDERAFQSGIMASAVNFGPDGALYVADWDGYWQPNDYGAIYRIDDPTVATSPLRQETKRLLATGMGARSLDALGGLLGHPDQRVRLHAQTELAARGADKLLLAIANQPDRDPLARIHALWGLGEMGPTTPQTPWILTWPWDDPEPRVRAQAAKVAGDLGWDRFAAPLIKALTDDSAPVAFQAGLAIGKIGSPEAGTTLVQALSKNNNLDPFLRHAFITGLHGCWPATEIHTLSAHPSEAVRRAAVVTLRRLRSPLVATFLNDRTLTVRRDAARAIHDDFSISQALPSLALALENPSTWGDEALARRALSANLRVGGDENAQRLKRLALNADVPTDLRSEALLCLASWYTDPFIDRVVGRVRALGPRDPKLGDRLLAELSSILLNSDSPKPLLTALLNGANDRGLPADLAYLDLLRDAENPTPLRTKALEILLQTENPHQAQAIAIALASDAAELRRLAASDLATRDLETLLEIAQGPESPTENPATTPLLNILTRQPDPRADPWLARLVGALEDDRLSSDKRLDVVLAAEASTDPELQIRIQRYKAGFEDSGRLGWKRLAAEGGAAESGRQVYEEHVAAQCVRCHNAGGADAQVGPLLNGVGQRLDRLELLESLILPSERIATGFQNATLTIDDGQTLFGTIITESDSLISLRLPDKTTLDIPTQRIETMDRTQVSAMPPMLGVLTLDEIQDLVAYLSTL